MKATTSRRVGISKKQKGGKRPFIGTNQTNIRPTVSSGLTQSVDSLNSNSTRTNSSNCQLNESAPQTQQTSGNDSTLSSEVESRQSGLTSPNIESLQQASNMSSIPTQTRSNQSTGNLQPSQHLNDPNPIEENILNAGAIPDDRNSESNGNGSTNSSFKEKLVEIIQNSRELLQLDIYPPQPLLNNLDNSLLELKTFLLNNRENVNSNQQMNTENEVDVSQLPENEGNEHSQQLTRFNEEYVLEINTLVKKISSTFIEYNSLEIGEIDYDNPLDVLEKYKSLHFIENQGIFIKNVASYHKGRVVYNWAKDFNGRGGLVEVLKQPQMASIPDNYATLNYYKLYYRIVNLFPALLFVDKAGLQIAKKWCRYYKAIVNAPPAIFENLFQLMRHVGEELVDKLPPTVPNHPEETLAAFQQRVATEWKYFNED